MRPSIYTLDWDKLSQAIDRLSQARALQELEAARQKEAEARSGLLDLLQTMPVSEVEQVAPYRGPEMKPVEKALVVGVPILARLLGASHEAAVSAPRDYVGLRDAKARQEHEAKVALARQRAELQQRLAELQRQAAMAKVGFAQTDVERATKSLADTREERARREALAAQRQMKTADIQGRMDRAFWDTFYDRNTPRATKQAMLSRLDPSEITEAIRLYAEQPSESEERLLLAKRKAEQEARESDSRIAARLQDIQLSQAKREQILLETQLLPEEHRLKIAETQARIAKIKDDIATNRVKRAQASSQYQTWRQHYAMLDKYYDAAEKAADAEVDAATEQIRLSGGWELADDSLKQLYYQAARKSQHVKQARFNALRQYTPVPKEEQIPPLEVSPGFLESIGKALTSPLRGPIPSQPKKKK